MFSSAEKSHEVRRVGRNNGRTRERGHQVDAVAERTRRSAVGHHIGFGEKRRGGGRTDAIRNRTH